MGRPFRGKVKIHDGEEKFAFYRKSCIRSLTKVIKGGAKKFPAFQGKYNECIRAMSAEDRKYVREVVDMFKKVTCQKAAGYEIVQNAMYGWNREVKETFFSNWVCSFLFIIAVPDIASLQEKKSHISKDNVGGQSHAIKKEKEKFTPSDKFGFYMDIIHEFQEIAFTLSLNDKKLPFDL